MPTGWICKGYCLPSKASLSRGAALVDKSSKFCSKFCLKWWKSRPWLGLGARGSFLVCLFSGVNTGRGRGDLLGQTDRETFTGIFFSPKKCKNMKNRVLDHSEAFLHVTIVLQISCKYYFFFKSKILVSHSIKSHCFEMPWLECCLKVWSHSEKTLIQNGTSRFSHVLCDIAWHFQNSSFSSHFFFSSQNYLLIFDPVLQVAAFSVCQKVFQMI